MCYKGVGLNALNRQVYAPNRLLHPLKRTRSKSDPDPGWQRIGWEVALARPAQELSRIRNQGGAESVAFSVTSPSASAISDSILWIERLIHAFGSPNWVYATELCNWHKDYARA